MNEYDKMVLVIDEKKDARFQICRRFNVARLELFGSGEDVSRFDADASDLDFLVDFLPLKTGEDFDAYFGLKEALESAFQKPVKLLLTRAVGDPCLLESISRNQVVLYAA